MNGNFKNIEVLYQKSTRKNVSIKTFERVKLNEIFNLDKENFNIMKDEIDYLSLKKRENMIEIIGWTVWLNKNVLVLEFMHTNLQSGNVFLNIFDTTLYLMELLFYSD